jgi:hypothetical protein
MRVGAARPVLAKLARSRRRPSTVSCPEGRTEAIMAAHGFMIEQTAEARG